MLLPHRSRVQEFDPEVLLQILSQIMSKIWPWEERCTISLNNVHILLHMSKSVNQGSVLLFFSLKHLNISLQAEHQAH